MALDLQQRATQHGHRRHNTRYETKNSRLNSAIIGLTNATKAEMRSRISVWDAEDGIWRSIAAEWEK